MNIRITWIPWEIFYFYFFIIYLFICLFAISWAALAAYGGSQARGRIGTIATRLRQSHSNVGSKPRLQLHHSSRQRQILNRLSKARDQTCNLMVPSRILSTAPGQELRKRSDLKNVHDTITPS